MQKRSLSQTRPRYQRCLISNSQKARSQSQLASSRCAVEYLERIEDFGMSIISPQQKNESRGPSLDLNLTKSGVESLIQNSLRSGKSLNRAQFETEIRKSEVTDDSLKDQANALDVQRTRMRICADVLRSKHKLKGTQGRM